MTTQESASVRVSQQDGTSNPEKLELQYEKVTEFEIQNYKKTGDNKYIKDGDPYQGIKESSIIEDIEINKNDIYRTLNTDNTFTEVKAEGKDKKYLSSIR